MMICCTTCAAVYCSNHEGAYCTKHYGFFAEVMAKYGAAGKVSAQMHSW